MSFVSQSSRVKFHWGRWRSEFVGSVIKSYDLWTKVYVYATIRGIFQYSQKILECILLLLTLWANCWRVNLFYLGPIIFFSIIFMRNMNLYKYSPTVYPWEKKVVVCTVERNDCSFLLPSSHSSKFTPISFKLRDRMNLTVHWFNWSIVSVQSVQISRQYPLVRKRNKKRGRRKKENERNSSLLPKKKKKRKRY